MILWVARNTVLRIARSRSLVILVLLWLALMVLGGALSGTERLRALEEKSSISARAAQENPFESTMACSDPPALFHVTQSWLPGLSQCLRLSPSSVEYADPVTRRRSLLARVNGLDWVFVFAVLGGIIAICLSFDACNGEISSRNLRLMLTSGLRRWEFLAGRFAGTMAVLCTSSLAGAIASSGAYFGVAGISPAPSHLWRLGAALLLGWACLALAVGLGLFFSSALRRPAASLAAGLLVWIIASIAVPEAAPSLAPALRPIVSLRKFQRMISSQASAAAVSFQSEREGAALREIVEREIPDWMKAKEVEALGRRFSAEQEEKRWEREIEIRRLRRRYDRRRRDQVAMATSLALASPSGLMRWALERLCDAGWARYARFIEAVEAYQEPYSRYVRSKTLENLDKASFRNSVSSWYKGYELVIQTEPYLPRGAVDASDMPLFELQPIEVSDSAAAWVLGTAALLLPSLILLVAGYIMLARRDV